MTAVRPFCAGDLVIVTDSLRGTVTGRIEDVRTPDQDRCPGPGLLDEESATEILRDQGVARLAVISYRESDGVPLLFVAMEIEGEWQDLQRQPLNIRHYAVS